MFAMRRRSNRFPGRSPPRVASPTLTSGSARGVAHVKSALKRTGRARRDLVHRSPRGADRPDLRDDLNLALPQLCVTTERVPRRPARWSSSRAGAPNRPRTGNQRSRMRAGRQPRPLRADTPTHLAHSPGSAERCRWRIAPRRRCDAVHNVVRERWMNGRIMWVTRKFRGQPCEF